MLKLEISTDLNSDLYHQSLVIRREVFIEEQEINEALEIEGEEESIYFLLFSENQPVATARLKLKEHKGKVQRVAVVKKARGRGIGREIMLKIEQWARENHIKKLILAAQIQSIGFYEKLGYQVYGGKYLDANIPHKDMEKIL